MQRFHFRQSLASLIWFALVCCPAALRGATDDSQAPEIDVKPKTNIFLAYGDPRFTDPTACEVSDSTFRRALVDGMAHEDDRPDLLVMTGDIVHSGEDERDWKIFDEETKILRDQKIRMFPVLGNHDVRGASGQKKFVEHFDELKSHPQLATQAWYTVNYSSTEFLLLDSQSSYEEQSPQGEWLRKKLKSVPEDLVFLVVVLHHPLISNASRFPSVYHCNGRQSGPAFGHSVESAEKHLRVLLEQFSTTHPGVRLLVLSGHNHNYERYAVNGITYVVTAGGGATPYRISRRPRDAYREDGPTFHYCKFIIRDTSMTGEMYKLTFEAGAPVWVQKDKFELSRPSTQSPNSKPPTSMPQQP